jgi:hypothetical protein
MLDRSSKHGWVGKRRKRKPTAHNEDSIVQAAAGVLLVQATGRTAAEWLYRPLRLVYGIATEGSLITHVRDPSKDRFPRAFPTPSGQRTF